MRLLLIPFRGLYCLYALLLFIIGMILTFPFVVVFSWQDSPESGDNIYRACRVWGAAWMTLVGLRHTNQFETTPREDRQYIFIANHISYLDIPLILRSVQRNSFRILGKAEMRKVPIFGYIYSRAVVMVDRSSSHQRSLSVRELKSVLAQGTSIFIFPEGTFNETRQPLKELYDGAFRIAIETQTPLQPILFLGTYEQMHYSTVFSLLPGSTRAIYLPAVDVEGLTIEDLPVLKQRVARLMEERLIRYQARWIQR